MAAAGLRCSFCAKTEDKVHKLIAGRDGVCICDECVAACVGIIREDVTLPFDRVETERWRSMRDLGDKAVCSLCGTRGLADEMIAVQGRGRLCITCANAVDDALATGD